MTELSLTSCCVSTLGSELRITQLYMRKHMRCCLLQTSTENPYSRGTSPQTVPSSSTKGTRPVWPNFPTNNRAHPHSWQQITDQPHDTGQIKTQVHTDTYMRTYTKVQNKPKQNTRPAQHVSCSPWQVLHFWRAHSPPNSSLMRGQIQTQVVDQKRTAGTGMNNPRATRREIWCYPARH